MACGCSVPVVLVALVLVLSVGGSKIYFPDMIHEVPIDIAIRKCLKEQTCDLPQNLTTESRCEDGTVKKIIDVMKKGDIATRTGGGGGGGGAELCNGLAGEVVWPATEECVTLLTQGPCPPGEWVQLLNITYEPVCRPACDVPLTRGGGPGVVVEGECYNPSHLPPATQCPNNQVWVANEHGEAECDCPPGLVYYAEDDSCYRPYSQGPCPPGRVIKVEDTAGGAAGEAKCFSNECPKPDMVRLDTTCRQQAHTDASSSCFDIGSAGPCKEDHLIRVDDTMAEPICLTTHCLFCHTVIGCPRGSFRDRQGRCRSEFDSILSSIPFITSTNRRPVTGGGRVCPRGQFFAGGTCIRVAG